MSGIAIREIEAWWLADRKNTLAWLGLSERSVSNTDYSKTRGYHAESDPKPERTLDDLLQLSSCVDQTYGQGNRELAAQFADAFRADHAGLDDIATECAEGFGRFQRDVIDKFRRIKAASR